MKVRDLAHAGGARGDFDVPGDDVPLVAWWDAHATEAPFMAENSEPAERIHLFSVGSGFRNLAAMVGALVAGSSAIGD